MQQQDRVMSGHTVEFMYIFQNKHELNHKYIFSSCFEGERKRNGARSRWLSHQGGLSNVPRHPRGNTAAAVVYGTETQGYEETRLTDDSTNTKEKTL